MKILSGNLNKNGKAVCCDVLQVVRLFGMEKEGNAAKKYDIYSPFYVHIVHLVVKYFNRKLVIKRRRILPYIL